jgi:hypothetical protein
MLSPRAWLKIHQSNGPVDVEAEAEKLAEAQKKAASTTDWLTSRN